MDNSDTIRIDDKDVDLIIDGEKYYKINNKSLCPRLLGVKYSQNQKNNV